MKSGNFRFELRRKLFHSFFGLFLIFILFYSGRKNLIMFVGWMGIALAALAAIVESLDTPVDDNVLIPVTAIIFFLII